ncbi:MAG: hypothetical protein WHX93_11085 [bacterium]
MNKQIQRNVCNQPLAVFMPQQWVIWKLRPQSMVCSADSQAKSGKGPMGKLRMDRNKSEFIPAYAVGGAVSIASW